MSDLPTQLERLTRSIHGNVSLDPHPTITRHSFVENKKYSSLTSASNVFFSVCRIRFKFILLSVDRENMKSNPPAVFILGVTNMKAHSLPTPDSVLLFLLVIGRKLGLWIRATRAT